MRFALAMGAFLMLGAASAAARPAPDSFADLAAKLLPTVVNIATSQTLKAPPRAQLPNVPPGSPLEDLFKNFLGPDGEKPRHVTSLGSGFIIDPAGFIVTNNHVIDNSDQVTVTLYDGSSLPAKIVGRDTKTDLALLKVVPKKPLPATHFGDSDKIRIGDWVMAIGDPFGLGSTVTAGIVSARNRDINAGPYDDFIQTDAPINRGNSGGPLFDMDGNVMGINSAIFSPSGGSVGIGFAIPANLAKDVVTQLKQFGVARRGWIGVRIQQVTEEIAQGMGLPNAQGALVADVTRNGPAQKAGLQNGDVVIGFDNKPIGDSKLLPRVVAATPIGKTVNIDVLRKGKKQSYRIVIAKLDEGPPDKPGKKLPPPAPPKAKSKLSQLGLTVVALDENARAKYKLAGNVQGVVVSAVDPASPAADKNFRPGDVIVEAQNQPVKTPADLEARVDADAKAGKKAELMLVNRNGDLTYVGLRLD
ncbi:MAG: DegQ family serine endoprotease [Proteobacteria bacterium]|nr:DegQ family serine endoprotease [Pseudomonadota bacterium]